MFLGATVQPHPQAPVGALPTVGPSFENGQGVVVFEMFKGAEVGAAVSLFLGGFSVEADRVGVFVKVTILTPGFVGGVRCVRWEVCGRRGW